MRILSLPLLAFLFFACGDADSATETMDDTVTEASEDLDRGTAAAQAEAEASTFLQTTIQNVQSAGGDITALPREAAANNINGWITKLSAMDGTDDMVDHLAALKKELMFEEVDGGKVSEILGQLAGETRDFSDQAPGLDALASALQAGADKLGAK